MRILDRLWLRMIVTMKGMFLSGGEKDEHEKKMKALLVVS